MNYYFIYDTSTGVIIYPAPSAYAPLVQPGQGVCGPFPQDTASAEVMMANVFPQRYLVKNGQLVSQPYFTLSSQIIGSVTTITATLNNPPATPPTNVVFTVLGSLKCTETLTSNTATLTLSIHPSVVTQKIDVSVAQAGCVPANLSIGGTQSQYPLQAYVDAQGMNHITPTMKSVLQGYYASMVPSQQVAANTLVGICLLADAIFNVLLTPAIIATLSADQQNFIKDFQANAGKILPLTLTNAYPSGGTKEIHYENFETNMPLYAESVTGYNADVINIPNLT